MVISRDRLSLVGEDANEILGYFNQIDGDWSLGALVRAIVIKHGGYSNENIPENIIIERQRSRSAGDMETYLKSSFDYAIVTIVECVNCFTDERITTDANWKTEFTFNDKPFPVNQYLSQFGRTKIYINEEKKRLVAFVDRRATNVWIQALESVLCRLMPWYYPANLPEEEQNFYKAIAVDNKSFTPEEKIEIFIKYVNEASEKVNFRDIRLHRCLDGIADKARMSRIDTLDREASRIRSSIKRKMDELSIDYGNFDRVSLELNALRNAEPEEDDSMYRFFHTHKQLILQWVDSDCLTFGVDDILEFYDEDEFRRMLNNRNSYFYEFDEDVRSGLKGIFEDKKGIIRVNAVFALQNFKLIRPQQDTYCVEDSMPNPHIYFFGCSGGNEQYYTQYAESNDWDLAIEQAISATKNLNWGDSTVCRRMINWLVGRTVPCVYVSDDLQPVEKVTKDMKLVTFDEFSKMIREKENEANG